MLALEVEAPNMASNPFPILTMRPTFTVPDTGCVYIGRFFFRLYRLPPGSFEQQRAVVQELGVEYFTFLESGSLVGDTFGVYLPVENKRVQGWENCAIHLAEFQTE
jgi:hypothetical protein